MKIKHWFYLQVLMSTVNGLSAMLMPVTWLSMYGMAEVSGETAVTAQALGAALFNYAIVAFFARDSQESIARKAIIIGFCLTHILGGLFMLLATINGVMAQMGYLGVFFYWLMATGYAFFWFRNSEE
jgi:hypothetical protein